MLKEYVPPFLLDNKELQTNYEIQQTEIDTYNNATQDLINQCFIDTATWGLKIWEKQLGIQIDETKSYELRRSAIKAKIRGQGTATVELMKQIIQSFTDGNVKLLEDNSHYKFAADLDIKSKAINFKDLLNTIETIKPVHLDYSLSVNLSPVHKGIYSASSLISGETISIYPWTPTLIQTKSNVNLGTAMQNIETSTLYPKE